MLPLEYPGRTGELELLRSLSHAFASATDPEEIMRSSLRWLRAAIDGVPATIAIFLPDDQGVLRPIVVDGPVIEAERSRPAKRQQVFDTRNLAWLPIRAAPGCALVMMPLVCRGESVGVLEIVMPEWKARNRCPALEAVASQMAIVLARARERQTLDRQIEGLRRTFALVGDALLASSPEKGADIVLSFFEPFAVPRASWVVKHDPVHLLSGKTAGMSAAKQRALSARLPIIQRWELMSAKTRTQVAHAFGAIVGAEDVTPIDAGDALILAAGVPAALLPALREIQALLPDLFRHAAEVRLAGLRNERLDLGIAWTAHELRGPLLGARAAIQMLGESLKDPERGTLEMAEQLLEQLADMVDSVLRYAAGRTTTDMARTNVVRVVREAIHASSLVADETRVHLTSPPVVMVSADREQLRSAIANLVGNALAYSPRDRKVEVSVRSEMAGIMVSVKDQGPGISKDEREAIFDPFTRGRAAESRLGTGLGLFIARRVAEAHGGSLWVESEGRGATFVLRLPPSRSSTDGSA
jgi:signal transduction histidine kinase